MDDAGAPSHDIKLKRTADTTRGERSDKMGESRRTKTALGLPDSPEVDRHRERLAFMMEEARRLAASLPACKPKFFDPLVCNVGRQ